MLVKALILLSFFFAPQDDGAQPQVERKLPLHFLAAAPEKGAYQIRMSFVQDDQEVMSPVVQVLEGRSATVAAQAQRPFVTAVKAGEQGQEPVITVVSVGRSATMVIHRVDADQVSLDATIEESDVTEVDRRLVDAESETQVQAPRIETRQVRVIEPVKLGEPLTVVLSQKPERTVQIIVTRR